MDSKAQNTKLEIDRFLLVYFVSLRCWGGAGEVLGEVGRWGGGDIRIH